YQAGTKKREFYLDQQLKIKPRRRLSPHYLMMMAKIAQTTTMRNTADILNLVFDSGITADSVMHAVHELGNQIANQIINRHDFLSVGHQGRLEARLSD
ncbi:ISLre2 family transposase, partial [Limosilactobacillus reuteri]